MNRMRFVILLFLSVLLVSVPIRTHAMQIFIEVTLDDGQNNSTLEVEPTDRVEDIKQVIMESTGIPVEEQVLIFAGKVLEEGNTLQDYSVQNHSIIKIVTASALDISRGDIVITETGYSVGGEAENPYTGSYVIHGNTDHHTITVTGGNHDLIFASLQMKFLSSADLMHITSGCVRVEMIGANVLQATEDGSGSAVKMSDSARLHLQGSGTITLVGGSNYWGGSAAVSGGSLCVDGGEVTLIGGNKIVNAYGHAFEGRELIVNGGALYCGVGYLNNSNLAVPTVSAPVQNFCGTLTHAVAHDLVYAVNGSVMTEGCTNGCGHAADATLTSDGDSYTYIGSPITPLVVECAYSWLGNTGIVYEDNIDAGTAKGSIVIGGVSLTKTFEIIKATNQWAAEPVIEGWTYGNPGSIPAVAANFGTVSVTYYGDDYDDMVPPMNAGSYTAAFTVSGNDNYTGLSKEIDFTIQPKEIGISWGDNEFTYDGTEKFPDFESEGIIPGDDVRFTRSGAATDASEVPWTAVITGITGDDAANYKLSSAGLTCEYQIRKAQQSAPVLTDLEVTDESISGKRDGKIGGLTTAMEYRLAGAGEYTKVTDPENMLFGPGTYHIRYGAQPNYEPSESIAITVAAGAKIKVTFIADGKIIDEKLVDYGEDVSLPEVNRIPVKEGYDQTAPYWDGAGKNITGDTIISAVYIKNEEVADILDQVPQTGDSNHLIAWFTCLVMCGVLLRKILVLKA